MPKYSELAKKCDRLRAYTLTAIHAAKSGHPGGSLSAIDLLATLYFEKLRHDPKNPDLPERDRVIISKGHCAPALYAVMAEAGYFKLEDIVGLRRLKSKFQGHPDRLSLKGVEVSTGCLGQGLGIAVGVALAGKLKNENYRVYCLMGDGEQQSGNIWESVMSAPHYKLDNLTAIVDKNKLEIGGLTSKLMDIDPLDEKYKSFGWEVIEIDGHDHSQIFCAYNEAEKVKDKPVVIIANTIKGKGVSFMENNPEWHSKAPTYDQLKQAIKDLRVDIDIDYLLRKADQDTKQIKGMLESKTPKFRKNYRWNSQQNMKVETKSVRKTFGEALDKLVEKEFDKVVVITADSSTSICVTDFRGKKIETGIAEQNMTTIAAGLAKEGFIPVIGGYALFSSGRNWDQLRTSICYNNLNVKVAGVGGLVGEDGATHQALEDLHLTIALPNMKVVVPCDALESEKVVRDVLSIYGPCFIRLPREKSPIVTKEDTPHKFGEANIIRLIQEAKEFRDAFKIRLASEYEGENEDLSIISCGILTPEAMRAAYILSEEYEINTRIIDMHTLKPIDKKTVVNAAKETKAIITIEEQQKGALGNLVASIIAEEGLSNKQLKFLRMGVEDQFGESGEPYELVKEFGLSAEHIASNAVDLLNK